MATKPENAPPDAYVQLGRAHRVRGNFAAAEAVLAQGLARHRNHLGLMAERSEIALARQDWAEAIARWQLVLRSHGERVPANMYARLVRAHRLSGDFAAAEGVIRDGLVRDPNHTGLASEHAEIAAARKDWPEAIKRWRAVVAAYGERAAPVGVYSRLARAHRAIDDFTAAESGLRDGLARHPGDLGLAAEHAEIASAREDWPEAIRRWRAVIAAYGETAPPVSTYYRLARAHRVISEFTAAETAIREGFARHPGDLGLMAEKAEIASAREDWPEAIRRWRAVIAAYGENAPPVSVYYRWARAHRVLGEFPAAESAVRDGLARHPGDLRLAAEHAEIASAREDWPEAIERWQAVIAAYGEKAPPVRVYYRWARAHRMLGDLPAAAAAVRDGLARHPADVGLATEHAEIATAQRDWPEVIKRWRVAMKTYGEKAPPARVYSRLARALVVQGDLPAAATVIRDGLARHPGDITLTAEDAEIAVVREASAGQAAAGAASERRPPALVYLRLARAYRSRGDLPAAESALRDGLAQHPGDLGLATELAEITAARKTSVEPRAVAGATNGNTPSADTSLLPEGADLAARKDTAANAVKGTEMPTEEEILNSTKYIEQREGALDKDLLPYGNPADKNVLVFGCGMGSELVWAARHRAKSALGIDLVPIPAEPVARALNQGGLSDFRYEIRNQNVHDLSLTGERFDLIVSNGVFEHVFDLKGTLEALRRLLRPNGRIAIYADGLWYSSSGGHTNTFLWEHLWKDPKEISSQHAEHWANWRDRCNRMTCADFIDALRSVGAIILQFNMKADPHLHYLPALINRIRSRIQVSATDLSVVSVGCELCWEENL